MRKTKRRGQSAEFAAIECAIAVLATEEIRSVLDENRPYARGLNLESQLFLSLLEGELRQRALAERGDGGE